MRRPEFAGDEQSHGKRSGMPAARPQAAENRFVGGFFIRMIGLRIKLPREDNDLILVYCHTCGAIDLTCGVVLKILPGSFTSGRFSPEGSTERRQVSTGESSMIRKAKAVWRGTGRAGNGNLSTDSGVLSDTPYSFRTRFENEKGTNPEELIAAAHAGCFTMALAFQLQGAGFTPTELSTEAAVSLEPEGQGFRITRSALTLRANVPNLDAAAFAKMAGEAEKNCPVSKVLNAQITLDAKLV